MRINLCHINGRKIFVIKLKLIMLVDEHTAQKEDTNNCLQQANPDQVEDKPDNSQPTVIKPVRN